MYRLHPLTAGTGVHDDERLAFSTAGDVVLGGQVGTSAAIVNGSMFIIAGVLISRPGERVGLWMDTHGGEVPSLATAQYAALPIVIALVIALVLAILMRDTHPRKT